MNISTKNEEINQKMREEKESDNKNIKNQIQALLKCDICNNNFDLNIHIPMVAKCGHTYCKKCIYNGGNKASYGICPIDNIHHVLGIESCIPNLKLELIIKKIFNYTEPKITEKKIICFNHEIKLNSNSIDKEGNKIFRSNSGNKKFFPNSEEIFPNILTDKKNKTITNFKINKDKPNNLKLYNHDNVDVIEELNVLSDDKIKFAEESKINDESIETIPLNDDKSNANISFKDEFNELLNKNSDYIRKNTIKLSEDINYDENKNEKKIDNNLIERPSNNNLIANNDMDENNKENKDTKAKINEKSIEDIKLKFNKNKIIILSDVYRNSINFFQNNKKNEIGEIAEYDELSIRPRTITVSKNIKIEQKVLEKSKDIKFRNNNKNEKNKNDLIENENTTIKKINIYDKILLKKRKTISQENNDRNRNIKIKINIKNKSEEKEINLKEINKVQINKKTDKINNDINIKKNDEIDNNNTSDIYIEEKKKPLKQKYKILSKKIGLKRNSDYTFIHSNSNSNLYSPTNINNSSEGKSMSNLEKIRFCKPQAKNSSLNNYYRANKLFSINSNETKKENKINFVSNDISTFEKKNYIENKIKNMNYSSNSYHKTKSTYNKKKLKGKSNLFLTVKNNYNISLNNSNNNITSNNNATNNNNNDIIQFMTHNNLKNEINNKLTNNNINRIKYSKISLSMSPDNKDILTNNNYNLSPICSQLTENKNNYNKNNNIHSTRDITAFNNNFATCSKDINGIIKTITIKRVNSFATKNASNQKNVKNEEQNNYNSNDNEDINEIKNKLRYEFNKVFNYQIDLYENLKDVKNKQILLSRNKKYKAILEDFISQENSYDDLKKIQICFLSEGELFIGKKELNIPIYGITYSLSGDYYKGCFNNGKKEGNGIMIYKNGTKYEGDFKNNKHEGFGKLKQLDGETFVGEWKDGKINGNGVRSHCNGDRYVGSYVNNMRNGHGIYTFSNGDSYEGNWINGKATGKGIFKFKNGDIYEGEFKDNIIMGQGNFKTKNGDIYLGMFKNGLINGKGILKYQNGEKYVGFFQNGKKNGIGKIYDSNGKVYKSGYWKKDKYIGNKYI